METPQVGDVWTFKPFVYRCVTRVESGRVFYTYKHDSRREFSTPLDVFVSGAKLIERNGEAVQS